MTIARRLGVVFAALALSALAVSPALATDLHQTGNITSAGAPQGSPTECAGAITQGGVALTSGNTLWRFTLVDHGAQISPTLNATFIESDGTTTTVISTTPVAVSDTYIYHFNIITPSDWVLVGSQTSTSPAGSANAILNLSFACTAPGIIVPESPASALLVLSAALVGFFFVRRQSIKGKASAA